MLIVNNPEVFTKSNSINMKPVVSAEWNYNFFMSPYVVVSGDAVLETLGTPTGSTISSASISKGSFITKEFTVTDGSGIISYPVTTINSGKAYKVVTFVRTNAQYPVIINTNISTLSHFDHGSESSEIDSLGWTKIETYIGSNDPISELTYKLNASISITNGALPPTYKIYFTEPEIYEITQFDYQYGSMFGIESPFKYFRPGESYVKTGNDKVIYPDNFRKVYTKDTDPYMPISPILYNPDFAIMQVPTSCIMKNGLPTTAMPYQYFISDIDSKIITAKYESDLLTNKIVLKFNTTITKPESVTISLNGVSYSSFLPDSTGLLTLYWNGSSWDTSRWSEMPIINIDGVVSKYTTVNTISVETTESLQDIFNNSTYAEIATNSNRMQIIEISPRLEIDLTDFVEQVSINKSLDSSNSQMPISSLNANDASITISGMPLLSRLNKIIPVFSNESNIDSTFLKGMLTENVKLYISFNTLSTFEIGNGSHSYPQYNKYIQGGIFYSDSWTENDIGSVTVQAYDVARHLQSLSVPDYVANLKTVFDIITNIMDLAGFTDYDYDSLYDVCNDLVSEMDVAYYYCSSHDKTIVSALSELFMAYQIGAYIDEYGVMRFLSLSNILSPNTIDPLLNNNIIEIDDFNIEDGGYQYSSKPKPGKIFLRYNPPKIKQSPSLQNIQNIDIKNSPSFVLTTSNDVVWSQADLSSLGFNYLNQNMSDTDSYFKLDVNDLLDIFHTYSFNASGYAVIEDEIVSFINKEYTIYQASAPETYRKVSVKNETELSAQISKFTKDNAIGFISNTKITSSSSLSITAGIKVISIADTSGFYKYGRVHIYNTNNKKQFMYGYITNVITDTSITVRVDNFNGSGSESTWTISNIPNYDIYVEPTGNITNVQRGAFNTKVSNHNILSNSGSISGKDLLESSISSSYVVTPSSTNTSVKENQINVNVPLNTKVLVYPENIRDVGFKTFSSKFELVGTRMSVGGVFFNMPIDINGDITSSAEGTYFVELARYTFDTTFDENTDYSYGVFVYYINSDNTESLLAYSDVTKTIKSILSNIPKSFVLNDTPNPNKYSVNYNELINFRIAINAENIDQGNVLVDGDETLSVFINNNLVSSWQIAGRFSEIISYSSSSSILIGTGSKTFNITGKVKYDIGDYIYISPTSDLTQYMFGNITNIDMDTTPGTSIITFGSVMYSGSGTFTSWNIYDNFQPININEVTGIRKKIVLPYASTTGTIFGSYSSNKPCTMLSYILFSVPAAVAEDISLVREIYATETPLISSSTSYYYQNTNYLNAVLLNQRDIEKTYCMQTKPEVVGMNYYDVEYQNPAAVDVNITPVEYLWYYIPTINPGDQRYRQKLIVNDYDVANSTVFNTGFKGKFILVNNTDHLIYTSKEADDLNNFTTKLNVWTHNIIAPSDEQILEKVINKYNTSDIIEVSSEWIQSDTAAYKMLSVIASGIEGFSKQVSLNIFGNPLIQVGDVVKLNYSLKGLYNQNYLVTNVSHEFSEGLSTSLNMIKLEDNVPDVYTVTYDEQGGSSVSDSTYIAGETIILPEPPIKDGITFNGWYTESIGGYLLEYSYTPNYPYGNITIYAQWEELEELYVLYFNSQGGTLVPDLVYTPGSSINLPNDITKEGYIFLGWSTQAFGGEILSSPYLPPFNGQTLYAQWQSELSEPSINVSYYYESGRYGTEYTIPTIGNNDDGYWSVTLPYPIFFNGIGYSTLYVGTNSYVTFASGSDIYEPSAVNPAQDKIMINSGDRHGNRIWFYEDGGSWLLRYEGANLLDGTTDDIVWELSSTSYTPNKLILNIITSNESGITNVSSSSGTIWSLLGGQETGWEIISQ